MNDTAGESLLVLWTTAERETVENMVFMYTLNAKLQGWWRDITILVWGAATKLASEDEAVQETLKALKEKGIRVIACKKCAENLGAVESLEGLGVEVFYTGVLLTEWIKLQKALLTV